jgi:hypothetical protein
MGRRIGMRRLVRPTVSIDICSTGNAEVTTWIHQESTGLLTQKLDAAGQAVTYTYDDAGRLHVTPRMLIAFPAGFSSLEFRPSGRALIGNGGRIVVLWS